MPLFLDGPGAERMKRAADAVLNGPQNGVPTRHQAPRDEDPTRRVMVTGPVDGGLYPATIQHYDSDAGAWVDFEGPDGEPLECLARAWDGTALEEDTAYGPASVVGFDDDEGLAVFAVPVGGGGAFSGARAYHTATQTISNNIVTALSFNSTRFDTDGYRTGVSAGYVFKAPETAYYLIGANVYWSTNTGSGGRRAVFIKLASLPGAYIAQDERSVNGAAVTGQNIETVHPIEAGDEVAVEVQQESGGTYDVDALPRYSPEAWITKLSGAGGGGLPEGIGDTGEAVLGSDYTITADDVWQDTGLSISLPEAGKYQVTYTALAYCFPTVADGQIRTRLYNSTGAAVLTNSEAMTAYSIAELYVLQTCTVVAYLEVAGATTVRLEAFRSSGPTWGASMLLLNFTFMKYQRIQ